MPPETAKYLRDMLEAVRTIEFYAKGKTIDDYLRLRWLRDAAQWNFCVTGEALTQLKRIDANTAQKLTDHAKIIALRNQLIHGYGVIDNRITWDIIEGKLPTLRRELKALIEAQ
jgi:uncharacterized protein with HEPN domain